MKAQGTHPTCANLVALLLSDLVQKHANNKEKRLQTQPQARGQLWHSELRPSLTVQEYLARLASYLHVSDACFAIALIYIDRLTAAQPGVEITPWTIHRLCAVSTLLAMKFHEDQLLHKGPYVAYVMGLPAEELSRLEINFCKAIDFDLYVSPDLFKQYCEYLVMMRLEQEESPINERALFKSIYKTFALCSCGHPEHASKAKTSEKRAKKKGKKTKSKSMKLSSKGKAKALGINEEAKETLKTAAKKMLKEHESRNRNEGEGELQDESTQDCREESFISSSSHTTFTS